jgi:hypothetical protein
MHAVSQNTTSHALAYSAKTRQQQGAKVNCSCQQCTHKARLDAPLHSPQFTAASHSGKMIDTNKAMTC